MDLKKVNAFTLAMLMFASVTYGTEVPQKENDNATVAVQMQENLKLPLGTKNKLTQKIKNKQLEKEAIQNSLSRKSNPKKHLPQVVKQSPKGLLEIRKVPVENAKELNLKGSKKGKASQKQQFEERAFLGEVMLPRDYQNISIFGENVATMAQASTYIRKNNPQIKLVCSPERLIEYYWEEAAKEGVRGDLALCQAIVETGFFKYGGDVVYQQNNFCGLGTTGGGVRGAKFKTPQLGVRAHIQHLLAYCKKAKPKTAIVDPRYDVAHNIRLSRGIIDKWSGLNGTWAMGPEYCEKIMAHYVRMLEVVNDNKLPKNTNKKLTMRERINQYKKK